MKGLVVLGFLMSMVLCSCGNDSVSEEVTAVYADTSEESVSVRSDLSVEDILDLVNESSKQNRYCSLSKDNTVLSFDIETSEVYFRDSEGTVTKNNSSELSLFGLMLSEVQAQDNVSISVEIDDYSIEGDVFYKVVTSYNVGEQVFCKDFFIDARNHVFVGVAYGNSGDLVSALPIIKVTYTDSPLVVES